MKKGSDVEINEHDDRIPFKSNLAQDVRSMLAEFSRNRRDQAEKSRIERKAFILDIKDQVASLCKVTPKEKEEVKETIVKVAAPLPTLILEPAPTTEPRP